MLANDVCRCGSNICPRRNECARKMDQAPGKEYWMSVFLPQDGTECEDFIPMALN